MLLRYKEGLSANQVRGRRRECNFLVEGVSKCLGVNIKRYSYIEIKDIDVCIEFEMLKVKVPIKFLGTMGFSPRRERR
jgi:hypothetical protein